LEHLFIKKKQWAKLDTVELYADFIESAAVPKNWRRRGVVNL